MSRIPRARLRVLNPHTPDPSTHPSTRPSTNSPVDASTADRSRTAPTAAPTFGVSTAGRHPGQSRRAVTRALDVAAVAAAAVVAGIAIAAAVIVVPSAAHADPGTPIILAANDLPTVIANLQTWVMGLLTAVATLFLVLAGVYWATAGGDPAQVDKAKGALKNALVGYGLAVLAPILLQAVKGIVGG